MIIDRIPPHDCEPVHEDDCQCSECEPLDADLGEGYEALDRTEATCRYFDEQEDRFWEEEAQFYAKKKETKE